MRHELMPHRVRKPHDNVAQDCRWFGRAKLSVGLPRLLAGDEQMLFSNGLASREQLTLPNANTGFSEGLRRSRRLDSKTP